MLLVLFNITVPFPNVPPATYAFTVLNILSSPPKDPCSGGAFSIFQSFQTVLFELTVPPPPPGPVVDQEQLELDPFSQVIGSIANARMAQVVTQGITGNLVKIRLVLLCGPFTLELQGVNGGKPNGVVLTSQAFPGGDSNVSFSEFVLSTPLFLSAGTKFAIVLSTTLDTPCSLRTGPQGVDSYAGGSAFFIDDRLTDWQLLGFDFTFQTLVEPLAVEDQQQLELGGTNTLIGGVGNTRLAQVVTQGITGSLVKIRLVLLCGPFTLELQGVSGGKPNGVVLTSQAFPGGASDVFLSEFVLSTPLLLPAGTQFAIVVSSPGACAWRTGPAGDSYAGGSGFFIFDGLADWQPTVDFPFQTVVQRPLTAPAAFSDGTTFGEINAIPDGVLVGVSDEPSPNGDVGVRIITAGPALEVTLNVCGGTIVTTTPPSNFVVTCGSVIIEVDSGSVTAEVEIAGNIVTVTVTAGGAVLLDPDLGTVENIGGTSIQLTINGAQTTLVAGVANIVAGIDIKPGADPNAVNSGSEGVIPVAILTTPTFDAASVNPLTVTLLGGSVRLNGKSGNAGSLEDVDGDGDLDLVVQIVDRTLTAGQTTATLSGATFGGTPITGADDIVVVP